MVRVWEKVVRETPSIRKLPAILPLVVHHSERGWESPTTLHGIIDLDESAMALVGKHVPGFEMMLDDLGAQTDDSLRARARNERPARPPGGGGRWGGGRFSPPPAPGSRRCCSTSCGAGWT